MRCADCERSATQPCYAGRWKRLGQRWITITRDLCDECCDRDVQERAEAMSS